MQALPFVRSSRAAQRSRLIIGQIVDKVNYLPLTTEERSNRRSQIITRRTSPHYRPLVFWSRGPKGCAVRERLENGAREMTTKEDLFGDLAEILQTWTVTAAQELTDGRSDMAWTENPQAFAALREAILECGVSRKDVRLVFADVIVGVLNSVVAMLNPDGSPWSDPRLDLVDRGAATERGGLNDLFLGYLSRTGQMQLIDRMTAPRRFDA
jgi:hypothetical protein